MYSMVVCENTYILELGVTGNKVAIFSVGTVNRNVTIIRERAKSKNSVVGSYVRRDNSCDIKSRVLVRSSPKGTWVNGQPVAIEQVSIELLPPGCNALL